MLPNDVDVSNMRDELKALKEKAERHRDSGMVTIHDHYTMAALTGLLASIGNETRWNYTYNEYVRQARKYADEAMTQRGATC